MKRFIAAVAAVSAFAVSASGAWSADRDTVKVVVKKIGRDKPDFATATREIAPRHGAQVVAETDATVTLQVPRARVEHLRSELVAHVELVEVRDDFDSIQFRAFPIDVRAGQPAYPSTWRSSRDASKGAREAFLIQFAAAPQPAWMEGMAAAGLRVISYVPTNAYVVVGDAAAVETIRDRFPVQFVAIHQPVHKIAASLRDTTASAVDVVVSVARIAEAADAVRIVEQGTLAELQPAVNAGDRDIHRVTLRASALMALANSTAVLWIEPLPRVRLSGEREVFLSVGDSLVTRSGSPLVLRPASPVVNNYRSWISSKGVSNYASALTVAILDTGFDNGTAASPHFDFRNGATTSFVSLVDYTNSQTAPLSDCYGHGTAVAGVISGNAGSAFSTTTRDIGATFGDYNYLMGLGVVPAIPLVSGRIFNYNTNAPVRGLDAQPWTTIYPDLASRNVRITNNSWNTIDDIGQYTTDAQILDRLVRHVNTNDTGNPMAIYFSAGNLEGTETDARVQPPATAKNVVSVGGSESYNPIPAGTTYQVRDEFTAGIHADNGYHRWQRSSFGTTDNRLKPDLLAPATAVEAPRTTSTQACVGGLVGSTIDPAEPVNRQHVWARGTSFASPAAVGNAALLYTWHLNKTGTAPSPAMLKAMQVNFAEPLPSVAKNPTTQQGFGRIDLTQAFKTDSRYIRLDQSASRLLTASGAFQAFPCLGCYYTIKDTTRPVTITLVWTDAAGEPTAGRSLVNDLDLVVSSASGKFAYGNDISATTGRSVVRTTGTYYDRNNNVEKVVLNSTDMGMYLTVTVMANVIAADAVNPWTGTTPRQDFALFIENVVGQ